ncbi:MAG: N-acetylmuramoyl-L-alanine amidase [Planctomycetes bacterium ADurb.Bin126]|nr:MAG: N-acetylmuramoyl-L-alanine amidase [Planctomycetes bacterium ADurb.Bin126]HOD80668.1 peptidoglycan recognition family protein [Phycisphaerae bacterium]HQL73886.1 peptidoglycan recognition family protein [Phycisphaerae bacterium]
MQRMTSWTMTLAAGALLAAGGCGRPSAMNDLPPHQMDLSAPLAASRAASPGRNGVPPTRGPSANPWAPASGYRQWKYIVIHHSATEEGSAAVFDRAHRRRGWDELGYHFVITNGQGGADGAVEVGSRWLCQKWGSHTGGTPDNDYNNRGIGICLVGDWSVKLPTSAQVASLRRLVIYLARTYHISLHDVIGHRDAPGAKTACPGDAFHKYLHGPLKADLAREWP